jgi:hypothetical protein
MTIFRKNSAIGNLTIIIIAVIVLAALIGTIVLSGLLPVFSGEIVGSGNLKTEEMEFSDFSGLDVQSGFKIEITQSSSYSVSITGDNNVFKRIEVSKTGDTLRIGLKPGITYRHLTLRAKITMPELQELDTSGGTHGTIEGFSSSNEFILDLSGGSNIEMTEMSFEDFNADLSGGSTIEIEGEAENLLLEASSGSTLNLSNFQVHDANVNLSGGSHGTININGRLDADISGGSRLQYIGEPTMGDISISGGSTISSK